MKKLVLVVAFIVFSITGSAKADWAIDLLNWEMQASVALQMRTQNLINWEVGEHGEYKITAMFGELGAMRKYVDREDGNAVWVISEVTGQMQQRVEVKLDRATGEILEYIENGVRKDPPRNDDFELIDQTEERITVPAGTFDTIKITAKTSQIKKLELWANPRDIVMEGMAQMVMDTGMFVVTIKLHSFAASFQS